MEDTQASEEGEQAFEGKGGGFRKDVQQFWGVEGERTSEERQR